jgi:hypothetical protein
LGEYIQQAGYLWYAKTNTYKRELKEKEEKVEIDEVPDTLFGNIGFDEKDIEVSPVAERLSEMFGLENEAEQRGLTKLLQYKESDTMKMIYDNVTEELPVRITPAMRERLQTMFGETEIDGVSVHEIVASNVLASAVGAFMAGEKGTGIALEGATMVSDIVQKVAGVDRQDALKLAKDWIASAETMLADNAMEMGEFTDEDLESVQRISDPRGITQAVEMADPKERYQSGITYALARAAGEVERGVLATLNAPARMEEMKRKLLDKVDNPVVRGGIGLIARGMGLSPLPTLKEKQLSEWIGLFDPEQSPLATFYGPAMETRAFRSLEAKKKGLGAYVMNEAVEGAFDFAMFIAEVALTKGLLLKTKLGASLLGGSAVMTPQRLERLHRVGKAGMTYAALSKAQKAAQISASLRNAAFIGAWKGVTTTGSFEDRMTTGLLTSLYSSTPLTTGLALDKIGLTAPGVVIPVLVDWAQNTAITTAVSHIPEYKRQGGLTDDFIAHLITQTIYDFGMSAMTRGLVGPDRAIKAVEARYSKLYDQAKEKGDVRNPITDVPISKGEYIDSQYKRMAKLDSVKEIISAFENVIKRGALEEKEVPGVEKVEVDMRGYEDPQVRQFRKRQVKSVEKTKRLYTGLSETDRKIMDLESRLERTPAEEKSLRALKGRRTRLQKQIDVFEQKGEPGETQRPDPDLIEKTSKKVEGMVTLTQDIKNQIRQFNRGFKEGKKITAKDIKAFQDYTTRVIESADFVTKEQKASMYKSLKKLSTERKKSFSKNLQFLQEKINELSDANETKMYKEATERLLKKVKNQIKKGKFDADTADAFTHAINVNKDPASAPREFGPSTKELLAYDIGTLNKLGLSKSEARAVYNDFINTYNKGAATKKGAKMAEKARIDRLVDLVSMEITGKRLEDTEPLPSGLLEKRRTRTNVFIDILRSNRNWRGLIIDLAAKSKEPFGMSTLEKYTDTRDANLLRKELDKKYNSWKLDLFGRVFGVKDRNDLWEHVRKEMSENIKIPLAKNRTDEINRTVLRQRYMELQQPEGKKRLVKDNQYTEKTIETIEREMTDKDLQIVQGLREMYDNLYTEVNSVFRKRNGYNLPYRKSYSPFIPDKEQADNANMIDLMHYDIRKEPVIDNRSPLKELKGSAGIRAVGDVFLYDRYKNDMGHYIAFSQTVKDSKAIFKNDKIRKLIMQEHGESMMKTIDSQIDAIARGKFETAQRGFSNSFNTLITRFTKGLLFAKPKRVIIQSLSTMLYLTDMPAKELAKGMLDLPRAVKTGEIEVLTVPGFMFERGLTFGDLSGLKDLVNSPEYRRLGKYLDNPKVDQIMSIFLRYGDRGAIYAGGWAMFKHYRDNLKLEKGEALAKTFDFINATQQSQDITERGTNLQTADPIKKFLFRFKHTPQQYFNNFTNAFVSRARMGKTQLAKTLVAYHTMSLAYAIVSGGFKITVASGLASLLAGPVGDGVILAGDALKVFLGYVISKAMDEPQPNQMSTLFEKVPQDVTSVINQASKMMDEGYMGDVDEWGKLIREISEASYPITGSAGAGVTAAADSYEGIRGYMDYGEFDEMLLKFLGYTDWQIDKN